MGDLLMADNIPFGAYLKAASVAGAGKTIACIGDSITARNTATNTDITGYDNRGFMTWANALLGDKRPWFPVENNFGVSGDTSTEILARMPSVVAASPDYCVILAGINDVAQSVSFDTIKTNLQAMWNILLSAGITPIVMTLWPEESASISADERKAKYRVNTFIRESNLRDSRILVCDPFRLMVDSSSATGASVSGYLYDTLHPTAVGAYWAGYALKTLLAGILPEAPVRLTTKADVYDATYNPTGNMLTNGVLDGTGGTKTGAGISGNVADSWTLYRTGTTGGGTSTCVGSKTTDTLDNGKTIPAQTVVVTCSGSGNDERFMLYQYINAGAGTYASGDELYADITVKLSGVTNMKYMKWQVQDYTGTAVDETYVDLYYNTTESGNMPEVNMELRLRTPVFTVADYAGTGTQLLRCQLTTSFDGTVSAGATIEVTEASVRKNTDI